MPGVCAARARRTGGVAPGMAAQRRAPLKRLAGAAGNQAALRRFPLLQRQTPDDPAQKPDPNQEVKPDPKPLIPLGSDWKLDPSGSHPGAPTPWDKPGPGGGGAGGSLEDIHKGAVSLFGPKASPGMNFTPPPCTSLLTTDSTPKAPKYRTFQDWDQFRKLWHSAPPAKDIWQPLTPEQYNAAVEDCKAKNPPAADPAQPLNLPKLPKQPLPDPPVNPLKPGQAYA